MVVIRGEVLFEVEKGVEGMGRWSARAKDAHARRVGRRMRKGEVCCEVRDDGAAPPGRNQRWEVSQSQLSGTLEPTSSLEERGREEYGTRTSKQR